MWNRRRLSRCWNRWRGRGLSRSTWSPTGDLSLGVLVAWHGGRLLQLDEVPVTQLIAKADRSVTRNREICQKKGEERQHFIDSRIAGILEVRSIESGKSSSVILGQKKMSANLFDRFRDGDEEAFRQLFEQYVKSLTKIATKHLSPRVSTRVDGEDVVQEVLWSFYRRSARGDFRIDESLDIWRLLVTITVRKARMQGRFHSAGPRDVALETGAAADDWLSSALREGPSPEEGVILVDQVEWLLEGQPELHADVVALLFDGHSKTDIARKLGISRQTVHRVIGLLEERLKRSL